MARSRRRDDDDDDDDTPRRKKSRSRDDDDDEDEDEDDAPRRKKSRRDDDDDDDDDPRRRLRTPKRSKKSSGGGGPLLLILGLVGGFVLLAGGGVAVWLIFFNETPKSAYEDFQNSLVAKNYGHAYDRFDPDAQRGISGLLELTKFDPKMAAHRGKSGRDLFIAVGEEGDKNNAQSGKQDGMFDRWKKKSTVESVSQTGDTATLTVKSSEGKVETVYLKKIEGKWRISLGPGWGK